MSDIDRLRRVALACVVLAVIVGVPASLAFFAAFGWSFEAALFGDVNAILAGGVSAALLLRWAAIGDMLFSYLLLVPLALFLHRRLRPNGTWLADLGAVAAFAYIFVGGAGAAILAIVGSSLVEAHALAAPADQPLIALSFAAVRDLVFYALWQMLDAITLGTWILTTGVLLLAERRAVSRMLVGLGASAIALSATTMLGIHSVALVATILGLGLLAGLGWLLVDRSRRPGVSPRAATAE